MRCNEKIARFPLHYIKRYFPRRRYLFFYVFLFLRKIFCLFGWFCVAQRKTKVNGKMPKIHITSCRQRNNFSAVSLTSVLSASHKNPQKIFSVPVQRHLLPHRYFKTIFGSIRLCRRSHLLFMPISR